MLPKIFTSKPLILCKIAFNILRSDQQFLDIQYSSDNQEKKTLLQLYPADSLNLFRVDKQDEICYKILDSNMLANIINDMIEGFQKKI